MLTHARAYAVIGLDAIPIEVETYVSEQDGAGAFTIVGLPDKALQEARARIRSAAAAAGLLIHKAVILANLAPAEVRKEGAGFDLPIALAVMAGFGWVNQDTLGEVAAVGELAFDGRLRPVPGILSIAEAAVRDGHSTLLCPEQCAHEASLVPGCRPIGCATLREAVRILNGEDLPRPVMERQPRAVLPVPD
ncbi:MAG: magnesium chelatase domain-containing protein, partial [Thermoleophilia bacterium]